MASCPDCFSVKISPSLLTEGDGDCAACYGTGESQEFLYKFADSFSDERTECPICNGSGQCQTCGGSGVVQDEEDHNDNNQDTSTIAEEEEYSSSGYNSESGESTIESLGSGVNFAYSNYSKQVEIKSKSGVKLFLLMLIVVIGSAIFYLYSIESKTNYNRNASASVVDIVIDSLSEVPFSDKWKVYGEDISQAIDNLMFRNAYKRAIAQIPEKVWSENKSWLTLQNILPFRSRLLSTHFGKFVYMSGCKPHFCLDSWVKTIYDPVNDSMIVWVFVYNNGAWMIGDNSLHIRILLKVMETIGERDVILPFSSKECEEIKSSFKL